VLIEDRSRVWFGVERARLAEGRAAARRHRNPIRLVPVQAGDRWAHRRVTVVSTAREELPLHRANMARGPEQVVVVPDEGAVDLTAEDWGRLGGEVEWAHLALPGDAGAYRYRLIASIALAEVARQAGRRAPGLPLRRERQAPSYDRVLATVAAEAGETVFLDELDVY
jgi:hypothetical protein